MLLGTFSLNRSKWIIFHIPVDYSRQYYCYKCADDSGVPPIPPLEDKDPLLMDSFTERSDRVGSCAKASMGRGFTYFALFNNGECLSSWDASSTYDYHGYVRATKQYCYYYCFWGCYRRCYSYLTQCGDGYGDSTKMNVYSFTSKSHTMWFCLFLFVVVVVVYCCFILSSITLDDTANRWISLFGEGLARTNLKYVQQLHE